MATMEVAGRKNADVTQHCEPCAEGDANIPAEAYCPVCNEYLCTACATVHQRSRMSRNHKLMDKASMPSKRSEQSHETVSEYCKDHPRELVKYYCPTHGDLLCGNCIVKRSHTCKMEVIADVSKGYRNNTEYKQHALNLKKITEAISKTKQDVSSKAVAIEDAKEHSVKQVRTFQAELIDGINKMTDEILTQIETKTEATHMLLSNLKTTSKTAELEAQSMANVIERSQENDILLFIATHQTKEKLNQVSRKIEDVENALKGVPQYSFTENIEVKSLFQNSTDIGRYKEDLHAGVKKDENSE